MSDQEAVQSGDSSEVQSILDRLVALKDDLAVEFEKLGFGKDMLLQVHNALDVAGAAVASRGVAAAHDLNDDLAASPEDRPAVQGQESTPINTDANVNQQSPADPAVPVVSGAPVVSDASQAPAVVVVQPADGAPVGSEDDEPHAPLPG
jgi:hypothetical protein